MGLQLRPAREPALNSYPSTMEHFVEARWSDLAHRMWLVDTPIQKVKSETIKTEIWDPLEDDRFSPRSLAALEDLQVLERSDSFVQCDRKY